MRFPFVALLTGLLAANACAAPPKSFSDAPLRAVQFIDRNEGWAAGDDGCVWHTIDGGETWERQPTGVRGSLRALHFLTPYTGWVVGREELPDGGSGGIVLATTDGGLKWSRIAMNTLPGLHAVKFFDDRTGIVAGDGNDRYSCGVFSTTDGGRAWTVMPGPRQSGWLAADFSDAKTGVLGGSWSSLAILRDSVFGKSDIDALGGRSILGVKLYRETAFAVGQGGMVLRSDDGGAKWKNAAPKQLAGDALTNCDFHAVSVLGEHAWVAGRPGTFVLHSADYGKTWEICATGQNVPLHGICFVDGQTGWAVGDLGTILATADGGKTWKAQRRGGERAAALFIHAGPSSLPLDALAQLGADDGYLIAALRVMSADPASAPVKRAAGAQRWAQSVRLAGGAAGECLWHLPLASYQSTLSAKDLVAAFDPYHAGRAGEMMLRHLVLAIRMWRPELVVGDDATDGPTSLCAEALKEAFLRAADPKAFAEQIEVLGLKPWAAKKLYATSDAALNKRHPIRMVTTDPLSRCGDSARSLGALAAEALGEDLSLPNERGYTLRETRIPDAARHTSLMEGITLAAGGTARREPAALTEAEVAALDDQIKAMRLMNNIAAMARPDWKAVGGPDRMIGQLGSMLRGLSNDQGARALYGVAGAWVKSGQWVLARESYELLMSRYPAHPLAAAACRWLACYASSSEARRRFELNQFVTSSEMRLQQAHSEGGKDPAVKQTAGFEGVTTESRGGIDNPEAKNWYAAALELEVKMGAFGPLYLHDAGFQFCLQAARRSMGQADEARKWYTRFLGESGLAEENVARAGDTWREVAAAEMWLANRSGRQPRPVGFCKLAATRPKLDGKLDDDCWKDAKEMPLRTAAGGLGAEYGAKAMFAFDSEFLYVAVRCQHPAGKQVPKVEKRQRDEDLRAFDRVGIMLDLDRDYQTYYHFQIDQRGCLAEDCWGDKTWNPKWFVAVHSDETSWTAEVAIPRGELTGDAIAPGRVWACNVVRVVPGQGVQSWSLPADVDPRPEGMGLLIFTEDRK